MKIVSIVGSLRKGNTLSMVEVANKVIAPNAEIEIIALGNLSFSFCTGCLQCDETKVCCIDDDMNEVIEKIKIADALIIGTPTRWGLLSGELKCFLDRLNPLATTGELEDKKALIFAVGQSEKGTEDAESVKLACASIETFCDNAGIEVVDSVCAYNCLSENDVLGDKTVLSACENAARMLINTI